LLEQLAEDDELIVDGLSILPGLEAEHGEVQQRDAVDLVDVGVRAEFRRRSAGSGGR